MLAGMFVIGASITIGNVVIPVIIRRDVPSGRVARGDGGVRRDAQRRIAADVAADRTARGGDRLAARSARRGRLITVAGIVLWSVHLRRVAGGPGMDGDERYSGDAPPALAPRTPAADATRPDDQLTGPLPVVARRHERSLLRRPVTWLLLGRLRRCSARSTTRSRRGCRRSRPTSSVSTPPPPVRSRRCTRARASSARSSSRCSRATRRDSCRR